MSNTGNTTRPNTVQSHYSTNYGRPRTQQSMRPFSNLSNYQSEIDIDNTNNVNDTIYNNSIKNKINFNEKQNVNINEKQNVYKKRSKISNLIKASVNRT